MDFRFKRPKILNLPLHNVRPSVALLPLPFTPMLTGDFLMAKKLSCLPHILWEIKKGQTMPLTTDMVQIWRVSFERTLLIFHHLGGLINFGEFYCIWLLMVGCFYGPFATAFTFCFSGIFLSGLTKPLYNNSKTWTKTYRIFYFIITFQNTFWRNLDLPPSDGLDVCVNTKKAQQPCSFQA